MARAWKRIFPGVSLGLFSGGLRYTVYRGTNLIRQEVIAKTDAPSVAYKFAAGLKGFTIGDDTRLVWRDVARGWQHYLFGGDVNTDPVALKARNRLEIVESGAGSVAVFPGVPQILLFARSGIEPRLQLLPQRQRDHFRRGSAPGRSRGILQTLRRDRRRVAAPRHPGARVRGELRALQRSAGHHAADGRLLLSGFGQRARPPSRR